MSSNTVENAKELFVNHVLIYNEKSASYKRTKKKWKHKLKGLFPISVQDLSENWLKERLPDGLIVMGGDGTINSTANIILNSGLDIPMGIIPGGGGNDFYQRQVGRCQEDNGSGITVHEVFELEYPNNIQKRCAINTVEWGIGALVAEKRENNEGRFLTGMLKYFYLVIKSLFEFNSWKATIRIDGKDMEFDDLSSVVVGFGSSTMGGGYIMFPEECSGPNRDAPLVFIAHGFSRFKALGLILKFVRAKQHKDHRLQYYPFNTLELIPSGNEVIKLTVDGELFPAPPVSIKLGNRKLKSFCVTSSGFS